MRVLAEVVGSIVLIGIVIYGVMSMIAALSPKIELVGDKKDESKQPDKRD